MIYDKGNSHCQICHFCVVGYLRKTLLEQLARHETVNTRSEHYSP